MEMQQNQWKMLEIPGGLNLINIGLTWDPLKIYSPC